MTEPADFDQLEHPLPGLEPGRPGEGRNEAAARRTIGAFHAAGLVDEQHAVMCEALLTCSRQLDRASSSAKAKDYGVAALIAQLRETYQVLAPEPVEGGERSAWDEFLDELANRGGSPTAVRDAP
jgi:hypothetical protein